MNKYGMDGPDFFEHEQSCPLCHSEGVEVKPHKECEVGQEIFYRTSEAIVSYIRKNFDKAEKVYLEKS